VARVFGFALDQAQLGKKHIDAKVLKGFGSAGVLEVVANDHGGTYRAVYYDQTKIRRVRAACVSEEVQAGH
jgi:phage-related protein